MQLESLAILQTSRDTPEIAARFQPDGVKFQRLLRPAMPGTALDVFDAVDQEYPEDLVDYSAFLITGSPSSVTEDQPWIARLLEVITELHERRLPTIGICFGHQAVAAALGGKVERAEQGWGLGIKAVHFRRRAWMEPWHEPMKLIHIHQDQVTALPQGAELLAGSDFCPHESFTLGNHIMTVQAHPEFDRSFLDAILELYGGDIPNDVVRRAAESAGDTNHGQEFAHWTANFLRQSGG